MRLKMVSATMVSAVTGLALAAATAGPALAQEQQSPVPMSATAITFEHDQSARIIAFDQTGASHVIVLDLSRLSAADREALGTRMNAEAGEASGAAGGGAASDPDFEGDTAGVQTPPSDTNAIEVNSSPHSTSAAGTFGQPGDASVTADGHANDTSNNTHGDISEGLQNQRNTEDDEANGGSQPNSPST